MNADATELLIPPTWAGAPELVVADTQRQQQLWAQVATSTAAAGDYVTSLYATVASDIAAVQYTIAEISLNDAIPEQRFTLAGGTLTKALSMTALSNPTFTGCLDAIQTTRTGIAAAFTEQVWDLVASMMMDLSHIASAPMPSAAEFAAKTAARATAATVTESITALNITAAASAENARRSYHSGAIQDAVAHMYAADLATFDAYLLEASTAVGDHDLALATLRWQAGCDQLRTIPALPLDYLAAVGAIRSVLQSVLPGGEVARLRPRFEQP